MSDTENARARAEALKSSGRTSSADRARFWAGLNRYLASEARHAHKVAEAERAESEPESGHESEDEGAAPSTHDD